jgi:type IV secretion system protein VirD4
MCFTAAFGFIPAALLFPAPFAGWYAIFAPAEHKKNAVNLIVQSAKAWASHRGYLPWITWPAILRHPHGFLIMAALMLVWTAIFAYMGRNRNGGVSEWGGPPPAGKGQHGTAHWRTSGDLANGFALWRAPKKDQPKPSNPSGILVGQAGLGDSWVLDGDQHTLLIGSPGSGKTRGVILETVGIIGSAGKESMVLADPKDELYRHAASWLRSQGYEIVRIDYREPSRGNRSDPMADVTKAIEAGRMDRAAALARDIGHLMTYSTSEYRGTDPVWPQSTEALITSLILAIAQGTPPEGGLKLREPPWTWPTDDQKHLSSVYASLLSGGPGGSRLDAWIMQFPPDHPVYESYGPVRLAVEKTRASILVGAAAALSLWSDTEIKWMTAVQDHDLAAPGKRPTAVFLVIPDEVKTRYPLATLYIKQTLQALIKLADENRGQLPVPVNFLLDEFGNLPQIRDFDTTVTAVRSRGIRLLLAVQDLQQLKHHYPEADHTIRGACDTWIYLKSGDPETTKEISNRCGFYTTTGETYSMPKVYWTSSEVPGHATNSTSLISRALVTPDEVSRWPEHQSLVLQARHNPAKLPLPDLSAWANIWPEIQKQADSPEPKLIAPVSVWRPPAEPKKFVPAKNSSGAHGNTVEDQKPEHGGLKFKTSA